MRRQAEWGVAVKITEGRKTRQEYTYVPTPKQTEYHETRLTAALLGYPLTQANPDRPRMNRLYGGAAGGGKSKSLRYDMYRKAVSIPGYTGAILRRTMPELKKTHLREMQRDAPKLGAEFLKSDSQMVFPNGSIIECGHCEDDDAVQKWLSAEYDQIGFDEGSTFEPDQYLEISTRARTSNPKVQEAGGPWCDVVTNPGGRCWGLLRDLFVTHTPDYDQYPGLRDVYDPRWFRYVKALLDDNPYIDPGYAKSLAMLSEARYEQLRWGAEFITEGAFFSTWRETRDGTPWHVQERTCAGATYACGLDWGFNAPGVIVWVAFLPDGEYHVKAEWKFRGMTAPEVAAGFRRVCEDHGIKSVQYIACDPNIAGHAGTGKGESILESLRMAGLPVRKSDNDRKIGWARVQAFLRESPAKRPWLTIDPGCTYGRRTMPAQVQDKHEPDDLDTNKDDHWADALRYFCMSRPMPWVPRETEPEPPPNSWGWWRKWHQRQDQPKGVLA